MCNSNAVSYYCCELQQPVRRQNFSVDRVGPYCQVPSGARALCRLCCLCQRRVTSALFAKTSKAFFFSALFPFSALLRSLKKKKNVYKRFLNPLLSPTVALAPSLRLTAESKCQITRGGHVLDARASACLLCIDVVVLFFRNFLRDREGRLHTKLNTPVFFISASITCGESRKKTPELVELERKERRDQETRSKGGPIQRIQVCRRACRPRCLPLWFTAKFNITLLGKVSKKMMKHQKMRVCVLPCSWGSSVFSANACLCVDCIICMCSSVMDVQGPSPKTHKWVLGWA